MTIAPGAQAAAFADGLAPALRLPSRVTAVVTAERGPFYLTILYALLLYRRDHELEPLHEDVAARAVPAARHHGPYDGLAFHHDVLQLVAWGAIEAITEALKLRSYTDNRRERYRYRLTDDAVALLEWLEGRLLARLHARAGDNRDRLTDVAGHLRELTRGLARWRAAPGDPDDARRAVHLVELIGDTLDRVGGELIALRADLVAFAARPYQPARLAALLAWLERYVALYVERLAGLRGALAEQLAELEAPHHRAALAACQAALVAEHALVERAVGAAPIVDACARMAAHAAFFAAGGPLARLTGLVDAAGRAAIVRVRRHLRELERRSTRLADLGAAIATIAAGPERDPRRAAWHRALVASAQVRVDLRPATGAQRMAPPPLRGATEPRAAPTAPPLARKRGSLEATRALAARQMVALRAWIDEALGPRPEVALAELAGGPLAGGDGPRRWLDVARAAHLGRGAVLRQAGAALALTDGEIELGDEVGMAAPAATLRRVEEP